MSESTLLIAFISFVIVLLSGAVIVRKISVRDIFEDNSAPLVTRPSVFQKSIGKEINTPKTLVGKEKNTSLSRENIYKFSKVIGIIGAVILFAPTPESFKSFGLGLAALGWILSKATAPPKRNDKLPQENSTAQKIRLLAGKPEYQAALKLLYDDYSKNPQALEAVQYQRAIKFLQDKGVPPAEAMQNLKLLLPLLARQKSKIP